MAKKKIARSKSGSNGASKKQAAKKKAADKKLEIKTFPLKRNVPPGVLPILANHVMIRHEYSNFHLFFFDAQRPLVLDSDSEETRKEADAQDHVDAHCVARVVIPIQVMPGLIQALQTNLANQQQFISLLASEGVDTVAKFADKMESSQKKKKK